MGILTGDKYWAQPKSAILMLGRERGTAADGYGHLSRKLAGLMSP